MLSSRNDWNYNAGMDESLNTHKGGGGGTYFPLWRNALGGSYILRTIPCFSGSIRLCCLFCVLLRAFHGACIFQLEISRFTYETKG